MSASVILTFSVAAAIKIHTYSNWHTHRNVVNIREKTIKRGDLGLSCAAQTCIM